MASIEVDMPPVSMVAVLMILGMMRLAVALEAVGAQPEPANSGNRRAAADKQIPARVAVVGVVVPARWSAPALEQGEWQIRRRAIPPVALGSHPFARQVPATA